MKRKKIWLGRSKTNPDRLFLYDPNRIPWVDRPGEIEFWDVKCKVFRRMKPERAKELLDTVIVSSEDQIYSVALEAVKALQAEDEYLHSLSEEDIERMAH